MKRVLLLTTLIATGLTVAPMAEARGPGGGMGGMGMGPGADPTPPSFAELDTNGDGSLSAEELAAGDAVRFARADANGDGEISAEELAAAAQAREEARRTQRAERMIERLDTDGNGTVSAEEFAAGRPERAQERRAQMLDTLFERMDTNDDGTVSEQEFETAMAFLAERGEGRGMWGRDRDHDRGAHRGGDERGGKGHGHYRRN
ncbi:EF-hand domain-containing protein [Vannielia litorea]|uniref:EF-hand domain-containing protein n=1 Tax=Vannielia litorea TaxID=1217970 RepID=UPI001BCBA79C|nr:EF-hand domain-containing protein [Vannielia litorea]MBS8228744.1 hypothetical protein [Vannielia litorea]